MTNDLHQEKRIALLNHLAILILVVTSFFMFLNQVNQTKVDPFIFVFLYASGLGTFLLNQFKKISAARFFALFSFNAIIYCAASSESSETGLFLYFGVTGLAAIVLFGYADRVKSYFFVTLSAGLYMLSQLSTYSPFAERIFSPDQIKTYFIVNVVVSSYVAVYLVLNLMRLSNKTEEALLSNNHLVEKQNADLTKANLELDRFVYSASHDLRAPLSSILGLIEICERSTDPDEVNQCLTLMKKSVRNMDEFTKEIISYSRNTRQELKEDRVVLFDLVAEVIESLQFVNGAEEIYIKYVIDKELCFLTDRARLKAILNNLIGNAFKYHDSDKEDQYIELEAKREGAIVTFKVTDNGSGISEEHVHKIFDMFYRASDVSKGSGLGLYIVKEIVQKMKGQIHVASEEQKGSTFTVTLPIKVIEAVSA